MARMSDDNMCWYSWNTHGPSSFVTLKAGGTSRTFRLVPLPKTSSRSRSSYPYWQGALDQPRAADMPGAGSSSVGQGRAYWRAVGGTNEQLPDAK
jgi:hypothetical protein